MSADLMTYNLTTSVNCLETGREMLRVAYKRLKLVRVSRSVSHPSSP